MNPITKALDEIQFSIPKQILNHVFVSQSLQQQCNTVISLDTRIREEVLEKRVFVDINIHGGTEAYIDLKSPVLTNYTDPFTAIYNIPDELTQNRPIVQVYSVHFAILGYQNGGFATGYSESSLGGEVRRVLDSAVRTPPAATSYLNLIAHNTVMARYVTQPYRSAFLRCRLGSDNALSEIRPQTIPDFAELCVLATKAYIYNEMLIPMDQGQLSGGQTLGVFRDKISEYSDANDMYREKLRRWKKISVFNDPEAHRRLIRSIVGAP